MSCFRFLLFPVLFLAGPCALAQSEERLNIRIDSSFLARDGYGWEEGQRIPDHILTDIDGKTFRLYDRLDRPTVINFWFTTCAPCIENEKYLKSFQKQYGINILGISIDERPEDIAAHAQRNDLHWIQVWDNSKRLNRDWFKPRIGLTGGYPDYLLIDHEGRILRVLTSAGDMPRLGTALQRYAAEHLRKDVPGNGN